jgi:hypothetical protein
MDAWPRPCYEDRLMKPASPGSSSAPLHLNRSTKPLGPAYPASHAAPPFHHSANGDTPAPPFHPLGNGAAAGPPAEPRPAGTALPRDMPGRFARGKRGRPGAQYRSKTLDRPVFRPYQLSGPFFLATGQKSPSHGSSQGKSRLTFLSLWMRILPVRSLVKPAFATAGRLAYNSRRQRPRP